MVISNYTLIQWGKGIAVDGDYLNTLPVSFLNTYSITISQEASTNVWCYNRVGKSTLSTYKASCSHNFEVLIYYVAVGY